MRQTLIASRTSTCSRKAVNPIKTLTQAREDFQRRYISRSGGATTATARRPRVTSAVDPRTIFRTWSGAGRQRAEPELLDPDPRGGEADSNVTADEQHSGEKRDNSAILARSKAWPTTLATKEYVERISRVMCVLLVVVS